MPSRKPVKGQDVKNQDVRGNPAKGQLPKRQVAKSPIVPATRRLPKERIITWGVIGLLLALMLFEWQSRRAYRKTLAELQPVSQLGPARMIIGADLDRSVYGWASKRDVTVDGKSFITLHWPSLFRTYTIWLSLGEGGFVTTLQTGATPVAGDRPIPKVAVAPPAIVNQPPLPGAVANPPNVPVPLPNSVPTADVAAFLESPVAKAFQKCHQLYFRNPEEPSLSEEVIETLQSVAGQLPKLELSTKPQEATWNHLRIFEGGIPFSAFRFSSALDQAADLSWIFTSQESNLYWYIMPTRGRMTGFEDVRRVMYPLFQDASTLVYDVAYFQTLRGGEIKPSQDYIVYFTRQRMPEESSLAQGVELATKNSSAAVQLVLPMLKAALEKERAKPSVKRLSAALRLLPVGRLSPNSPAPEIAELVGSPLYASPGAEVLLRGNVPVQVILPTPDANRVVLCEQRNTFSLWDLRTKSILRKFHVDEEANLSNAAISSDGERLATTSEQNPNVLIWDLKNANSDQPLKTVFVPWSGQKGGKGNERAVRKLSFLNGHDQLLADLVAVSNERWVETAQWDVANDREIRRTFLGRSLITSTSPLRGGEQLVVVRHVRNPQSTSQKDQSSAEIAFLDAATSDTKATMPLESLWTFGDLLLSPDEKLATVNLAQKRIVIDCDRREVIQQFSTTVRGRTDGRTVAEIVTWSPDSRLLAMAYPDASVRIWDVRNDRLARIWRGHVSPVTALAFTSDGRWLASSSDDGTVRLWPHDPAGLEIVTNSLGMKLVPLPDGEFLMGTLPGRDGDMGFSEKDSAAELPAHRVRISQPFYMGMHEVTVKQFRQFVEATGHKTTAETNGFGGQHILETKRGYQRKPEFTWRNPGFPQTDDHPVIQVSWDDVQAFCKWLSAQEKAIYRLPTEAEWEYACRAGESSELHDQWNMRLGLEDQAKHPEQFYGNAADQSIRDHYKDYGMSMPHSDGFVFTAPVGSYAPNLFGLHDMHGNVFEWCADWFDRLYYRSPPVFDPQGPATGKHRVQRGGSFFHHPNFCRSCYRDFGEPNEVQSCVGFRVVREMSPPATSTPNQN